MIELSNERAFFILPLFCLIAPSYLVSFYRKFFVQWFLLYCLSPSASLALNTWASMFWYRSWGLRYYGDHVDFFYRPRFLFRRNYLTACSYINICSSCICAQFIHLLLSWVMIVPLYNLKSLYRFFAHQVCFSEFSLLPPELTDWQRIYKNQYRCKIFENCFFVQKFCDFWSRW